MTNMEVENHDDFYAFETDGRVIVSDSTGTNIIYDVAFDDLRYDSTIYLLVANTTKPL